MMQHELEERLGCPVRDYDWPTIHFIYQWSPEIPDVGGKDILASKLAMSYGETCSYDRHGLVEKLMPGAIAAARAAGCAEVREERGLLITWDIVHGYCFNQRGNPIGEVYEAVTKELENRELMDGLEYFSLTNKYEDMPFATWPTKYRWVACYAVTGGSEGHYIHVDLTNVDGVEDTRRMVFLGKTFRGMEFAQEVASVLGVILVA